MEFSRPEYWCGEPFPSPEDLPDPGVEPRSPALQVDSLPAESPGKHFSRWQDSRSQLCIKYVHLWERKTLLSVEVRASFYSHWMRAKFNDSLLISREKAVAPHSSTLPWGIQWTEEPGRLQSMGSLRVGHDWAISLSLFTFLHWRRKWQPTPVFLPGGRIPGMVEPGGLPSMGLPRVGHDWSDLAAAAA